MTRQISTKLDRKKHYLQVALNSTLEDARKIISALPVSDRILVEVGTPLIKKYGEAGIRQIRQWYSEHVLGPLTVLPTNSFSLLGLLFKTLTSNNTATISPGPETPGNQLITPYIVADLKTMDRGETEVEIAAGGGANAAVALGNAPTETLDAFIAKCNELGLDAMVDMMNVNYPLEVLRALKKVPPVVIIHRGVDEEKFNREKMIPLHEIRRIKGNFDIMISIAGGDTLREVQTSIFNDADIVVVWKSVYQKTEETIDLINGFLKEIK